MATFTHRDGAMEPADSGAVGSLLSELDVKDDEHQDVAVSDECGWTLSAFPSGKVVWENVVEARDPRHLTGLSRSEMESLFRLVIDGDLDILEDRNWVDGY